MPPLPPASTTGSSPDGAGRAESLESARPRGELGELLDRHLVEELEADGPCGRLVPGLQPGVADRHARHGEAGARLVVRDEQPVRVGHQDLAARPAAARLDLGDRVARATGRLVGPAEQFEGLRLRPERRERPSVTPSQSSASRERADRDGLAPAAAPRRPPTPRSAARSRPRLGEVGGVGEPGRLARDHPDARTALPARRELLDPSVVEARSRGRPVLGEHLRELAAVAERLGQHPFEHGGIDHGGLLASRRSVGRLLATSRMVPACLRAPVSPPASS